MNENEFQGGVNQAQDLKQKKDKQLDFLSDQAKVLKE